MPQAEPRIAVILPCRNEEAAVAGVISAFRRALPRAEIYVFDNASSDATASVAESAGAIVRAEAAKGKGNAVRRAFADVEADIYVIADGDGTYDASAAPMMIETMRRECLDMIVGARAGEAAGAFRPGHVLGNRAFSFLFRRLFRVETVDLLSGYRVLSRRFVKSFPSVSKGFEIELEISTHAALLRAPFREVGTQYGARPVGGKSKLNTLTDGARILRRMLTFLRLHRPLFVFASLAAAGALLSIAIAIPVFLEFFQTGLVPRFPTAILATGVMLAAIIVLVVGVILDAQARYFAEMKRLHYLQIAAPVPLPPAPLRPDAAHAIIA